MQSIINAILQEELEKNEHFLESKVNENYPVTIKARARTQAIRQYFEICGHK